MSCGMFKDEGHSPQAKLASHEVHAKEVAYTDFDAVSMYTPYYQRMENLVNATFHFLGLCKHNQTENTTTKFS